MRAAADSQRSLRSGVFAAKLGSEGCSIRRRVCHTGTFTPTLIASRRKPRYEARLAGFWGFFFRGRRLPNVPRKILPRLLR